MNNSTYKIIELFILFIALPVSLLFPYALWLKGATILVAFVYLLFILFKKTDIIFKIKKGIDWKSFWKETFVKFILIAVITSAYVWIVNPDSLFCVPRTDVLLFIVILLVYTFLSVWPQEVIYRTFFFERYEHFFKNKKQLIFINAVFFALAHLFFRNTLVIILTFLGGLLFGYTYFKTRSTTLVSIEHTLYGNWLFTVGMGDMLAFPGMEGCAG